MLKANFFYYDINPELATHNEKVFALAVQKRGTQALDGHLYKIARWQGDEEPAWYAEVAIRLG